MNVERLEPARFEFVGHIDEMIARLGESEALVWTDLIDPSGPSRAERISRDEANRKARELLDADPTFRDNGQRKWAKAIGCSAACLLPSPG